MWVVLGTSWRWPNPDLAGTGCAAGSGKQPGPGRRASGGHFGERKRHKSWEKELEGPWSSVGSGNWCVLVNPALEGW